MLMPPVSRYMSQQPWTIPASSSVSEASAVMREHGIRHLPVLADGALVGIVSERDLCRHEAVCADRTESVRDAMTERVFAVTSNQAVDEVARMMSERKYGSAVVLDSHGVVEGIFTAVDACRALVAVLDRATG